MCLAKDWVGSGAACRGHRSGPGDGRAVGRGKELAEWLPARARPGFFPVRLGVEQAA